MTDFRIVGYNELLNRMEVPSGADRYHSAQPAIFDDTLTVTGLVNGRDLAADGTKLDLATMTAATDLDAMRVALGYITVTQAVDLDALETRVDALSAAVVLKGTWDASTNLFPVSTVSGESWICSVAGVVDGISCAINDRVVALIDGANIAVYVANWHKLDYTDEVLSVAGRTGAVVLVEADITDLQSYVLPVDLDSLAKLNILVGESILVAGDPLNSSGVTLINQTPDPAHAPGHIFYKAERGGGFHGYVESSAIKMNFGEEEWTPVINNTGVEIADGTPVYSNSVDVATKLKEIVPLVANNGYRLLGLLTHTLPNGEIGKVTRGGSLSGPDYSAFTEGDTVYVRITAPAGLTSSIPLYPARALEVGTIVDNGNPGEISIDIAHHTNANVVIKSYNFSARTLSSGIYYLGGFYKADVADMNLTQASPTSTHGTVGASYAAHAFMVFGAASTDGTNVTLTVSGTSITDAGVETPADSEVLYTGTVAGLTLNDYFETEKKWLGQITHTLTSDGVNFTFDCNHGHCKYEDFNNLDSTLRSLEFVGLADSNDSGFNLELILHKNTNWTYHATAFVPGPAAFASLNIDHSTANNLIAGEPFSWKRTDLIESLQSGGKEGLLVRVTTSANNAIAYMNGHVTAVTDE